MVEKNQLEKSHFYFLKTLLESPMIVDNITSRSYYNKNNYCFAPFYFNQFILIIVPRLQSKKLAFYKMTYRNSKS